MKIAIVAAVYHPMINGVAVFSHHLATGFRRRGHQVLVICPSQTGRAFTRVEDGVKVAYQKSWEFRLYPDQIHTAKRKHKVLGHELPRLFYRYGLRVCPFPRRDVEATLANFQPDVVHVQVSDPLGAATVRWARRHEVPIVTTEHNHPDILTDPLGVPGFLKRPLNRFLAWYFVRRQNRGDFATMPTERAIKDLVLAHGLKFKVPVAAVSNGVDLADFHPGRAPKALYRKYNLPEDAPLVLYVGRVDPEKKINILLDAFAQARTKVPEAHLVIAGDGVARARLERQVEQLDLGAQVHFLGRVVPPELMELYRVGTIFATASDIETQGIVLIEAAATGLPLVAVDVGAVAEVCQNGKNGILCHAGDSENIAAALAKLLDDAKLRAKYSVESLRIASTHDLEHTLDRFLNIYQRVQEQKSQKKSRKKIGAPDWNA